MPDMNPRPLKPEEEWVSIRMTSQRRKDTAPEIALRRLLHKSGLRYRLNYPVPGVPRRTIDIAFPKSRVAVFVDGCFWHGCPIHSVPPKHNTDWWVTKIASNRARDLDTNGRLEAVGWRVVRCWEHEVGESESELIRALVLGHHGVGGDEL